MQPAQLPLAIYRGDTVRLHILLWAADGVTPINLAGVTAKSEIRERPAGVLISAFVCTITLPNIVDLFLTTTLSHTLPSKGVWDLQLTYPTGDVMTPLAGPVTVTADVTGST